MASENEDAALLAEARAGSRLALSRLIDRHQQAVRAFLRRVAADREEADDLAQETFVAAWAHLASWRGQSSVRSWLLGIAWRKARSAGRSMFRRMARDGAWSETEAMTAPPASSIEDRLALTGAMQTLNLQQRAAVALCLAEDYSHTEAAAILDLPLGTLKSQVLRARSKLIEALEAKP
jgi:RNA polymerase sigma-70 factor (ECF subfamily)